MAKAKKDGKSLTFKIKQILIDQLDDYSEQTAIPKTAIVEKALEMYFEANADKIK